MAKVTIIVGLPGSGKSELVADRASGCPGVCVEDFMKGSRHTSHRFPDSIHYPHLIRALRDGKDCIIADIAYCDTGRRLEAEQILLADVAELVIDWVFFDNDKDACITNVKRRNRTTLAHDLMMIEEFSAKYMPPQGVPAVPVWRPKTEPAA